MSAENSNHEENNETRNLALSILNDFTGVAGAQNQLGQLIPADGPIPVTFNLHLNQNVNNIAGNFENNAVKVEGKRHNVDLRGSSFGNSNDSNEKATSVNVKDLICKLHNSLQDIPDIQLAVGYIAEPVSEIQPKLCEIKVDQVLANTKLKQEYNPKDSFTHTRYDKDNLSVKMELNCFHDKKTRHTMLLGNAGEGKTSTLRRYSRKVSCQLIPSLNYIELVLFLEFKNFVSHSKQYLWEFITGLICPEIRKNGKKELLEWMIENSNKVLICIDGYDQCTSDIVSLKTPKTQYDDKALPMEFIRDILSGHLFKDAKILTSSRNHAVHKLSPECLPDKFVALCGLDEESVDILVKEMAGDDGDEILQKLKYKNVVLYDLCCTPLFLSFIVALYISDPDCAPDTLTGVVLNTLLTFMDTDHIRGGTKTLPKLMKLAFKGTTEGRVIFDNADLKLFNLQQEDVVDLLFTVSKKSKSVTKKRLLEGNAKVYFIHQAIQELLTSLEIITLSAEDFKNMLQEQLDKPHFEVIQRMVLGLVINQSLTNSWVELERHGVFIGSLKDHKNIALEYLSMLVARGYATHSLLLTQYECGEGAKAVIRRGVHLINLHAEMYLSKYDLHCAAKVYLYTEYLRYLFLSVCNLGRVHLEVFYEAIQNTEAMLPRIEYLNISDNLGVVCSCLGKIVSLCQVSHLEIINCNISKQDMKDFSDGLFSNSKCPQITWLDVSYNPYTMGKSLAKIVSTCGVEILSVTNSKFTKSNFEEFVNNLILDKTKLEKVSLKKNLIQPEFIPALTKLMSFVNGSISLSTPNFMGPHVDEDATKRLNIACEKHPNVRLKFER